jgi:DNA-binding winged helix-turn-helix (wHTH) protein
MNVSFHFDRFIFDPDTGELLKSGVRVRLSMQTATILELLLMQAGRIVSREHIKDALWPEHEYLSHDKVINNGIGRLRRVFEDDYLNCKYIECVPGLGYRFKSQVRQLKVDHEMPGLYMPAPKPAYINVPDSAAQPMAAASDNQHSLMEDEVSKSAPAGELWNSGFGSPSFAIANRGFDMILRTWALVGFALRTYCSSWYIKDLAWKQRGAIEAVATFDT